MDWQTIEDQCLKANKFFGQLVGVWPNQEKFTKIIIRFVIFIIVITTITAQVFCVVMLSYGSCIQSMCFSLIQNIYHRPFFFIANNH